MNSKLTNWIPWLMGLSAVIGLFAGLKINKTPFVAKVQSEKDIFSSHQRFQEATAIIEGNLIGFPEKTSIQDLAITGIIKELDPYARFYSNEKKEAFLENFSSEKNSFGLELKTYKDDLLIKSIYHDDIVKQGRLSPGSKITKINDQPVSSYKNLASVFKGDSIKLATASSEAVLTKKNEIINSVGELLVLEDKVRYFRIKRFRENTFRQMMSTLDEAILTNEEINLIIDLRGNPGGYIEEAVKIVNQFIPNKDYHFLKLNYANGKDRSYKSTGKAFGNFKTIVIVIDENTASSAEIVAGALRSQENVIVLGKESQGKRTVQRDFVLSDESHLYLTVAKFDFPGLKDQDSIFGKRGGLQPEIVLQEESVNDNECFYSYCQWLQNCTDKQSLLLDYQCLESSLYARENYSIQWFDWLGKQANPTFKLKILNQYDPYVVKALDVIKKRTQ